MLSKIIPAQKDNYHVFLQLEDKLCHVKEDGKRMINENRGTIRKEELSSNVSQHIRIIMVATAYRDDSQHSQC